MRNIHVCHVGTIFIDRDGATVLLMLFCEWVFARLIVQHKESWINYTWSSYFYFFIIDIAHYNLKNRYSPVESNNTLPRISMFFNVKTSP